MANDEIKIDDVDEMFESFVKKKLQQLGIKRAASKSVSNDMSDLEQSMKHRLEQNMAEEMKKREITNGLVEINNSSKVKKSKKAKKERKKKKKKNKKDESKNELEKSTKTERSRFKNEKISEASETNKSFSEISEALETKKSSSETKNTKDSVENVPNNSLQKIKSSSEKVNITENAVVKIDDKVLSNVANTTGPKKDIATIKLKIELMKAKSEGERLQEEANGLLKQAGEKPGEDCEVQKEKNKNNDLKRKKSSSKSRSRSPSKRSKHRSHRKSRSRSRSRSKRHRRSHSHSKHRRSHRSRSRSKDRHKRSRSRDTHRYRSHKRTHRSRSPVISTKDKVRLLEIAKVNALAQHKVNYMASSVSNQSQILKSSLMSVKQLTDICKDISSGKEEASTSTGMTKEGAEKMLEDVEASNIHHPFAVRETPSAFNIKPIKIAAPLPLPVTKALSTLTKEFPVSCGQQHRRKEVLETVYGKWEAVAKDEATKNAVKELVTSDKVFVQPETVEVDITSVIANRISAARILQTNPNSTEAQVKMSEAQKQLDSWTKSQQVPGQFTGSTALHPMPKAVLTGGKQAWFKADDFKNAKHVGGIGKSLLQKMGWTPGQPLGKTMVGGLEPLSLNVKTDRRGLSSFMEVGPTNTSNKKNKNDPKNALIKDLSGKHPVSALMEICSKRHWTAPDFRLTDPCDIKSFTYRVKVCNDEYIGKPANNKKEAKLKAATVALQCMGLLPRT